MALSIVIMLVMLLVLARVLQVRWQLTRTVSEAELLIADLPRSAASVDAWLHARDQQVAPVHPDSESSVSWAGAAGVKTDLCVIFLHGWGAGPPEVCPVDSRVATALGANLLRYRYTGHGLSPMERGGAAMASDISNEVLRRDAATAYLIGRLLGTRVVLIGCSTGGALSLWLSGQRWVGEELAAIMLLSPGFRLTMPKSQWLFLAYVILLLPPAGGNAVLRYLNGGEYKHATVPVLLGKRGEAQLRCWTRTYPVRAVRHLLGFFILLGATARFDEITQPVLAFANPTDTAVSFEATREAVEAMPKGELVPVTNSENVHCITGWITSPSTVDFVVERTLEFLHGAGVLITRRSRRAHASPHRSSRTPSSARRSNRLS